MLSNAEAEMKTVVAYKKACSSGVECPVLLSSSFQSPGKPKTFQINDTGMD